MAEVKQQKQETPKASRAIDDLKTLNATTDKETVNQSDLNTLKEKIAQLTQEKSLLDKKINDLMAQLTKCEDERFVLTNDFTTADEGSVVKLRDEYRHMQHNLRAAAMREHKKLYDDIPLSLTDHCMLAYKNAKECLFDELNNITDESLYQLQTSENSTRGSKLSQNYLLLIKSLRDDLKVSEDIKMKIEEALTQKYKALTNQAPKGIPKSIEEYYSTLAKFSWDCVARPIPLIMSTDYTKFDKEIHETREAAGDDDDDNEGKDVSYIYPVLFTSSNWPREVALKGKVIILPLTN